MGSLTIQTVKIWLVELMIDCGGENIAKDKKVGRIIGRMFTLFCLFVVVNILPLDAYTQDAAALPEPTQATPPIPDEFVNLFDQLKCDYEEFARKQTVIAVSNQVPVKYIIKYINESKLDDCQLFAFAELLVNTLTEYHPHLLRAYLPYVKDAAVRKSSDGKETYVDRDCSMIAGRTKWFELFLAAMSSKEGLAAASEIILDPDTDSIIRFVLFNSVFNCNFRPDKNRVVELPSFGRQIRLTPLNGRPEAVALLKQLVLNPMDLRDEVFQIANSRQDIIDDQSLTAILRPDQFGKTVSCPELQTYIMRGKKKTLAAIDAPTTDQLQTADVSVGNHVLVGFNIALNIGEKPAQPWVDIAKAIVSSAFKSQTLSPEQLVETKQLIADFPEEWPPNDYIRGPLKAIEAQLEKGDVDEAKRSASELKTYLRTYQYGDTLANAAIDKLVTFIDSIADSQSRVMIKTSVPKCDSNELRIKDNVFRSDVLLLALQVLGLAQDPEGLAICRSLVDKKTETNYKLAAVLCLLWNGADAQDTNRVLSSGLKAAQFIADDVGHYSQFFAENIAAISNTQSQETISKIVRAAIDYCSQHADPGCYSYGFIDALLIAKALSLQTKSQLIFASAIHRDYNGEWTIDCATSGRSITKWNKYCLASQDKTIAASCLKTLWENAGQFGKSAPVYRSDIGTFGLFEGKVCREAATSFSATLDWPTVKEILETKVHGEGETTIAIAVSILKPQKSKDRKKYLLKFLSSVPKGSLLDTEIRAMLKEK